MNIRAIYRYYFNKYKLIIIASIFLVPLGFTVYINGIIKELPPVETLQTYSPALATKVYDRNGNLICELFTEKRRLITLKEIPQNLKKAVLAIEDTDFYKHYGFSPRGILRATINNIFHRKKRGIQGGSTLTQQLSKTIFLTRERTIRRKVKELLMAVQLERNLSKDEILELYLNQVYYGAGAYGVESAARIYFSKLPMELELHEAALLAGLIKAPNYFSPFTNYERAKKRRATILARMRRLGYITPQQESEANNQPLPQIRAPLSSDVAPYFVEYVRLQLEPIFGEDLIYRGGLSIYTTLDLNLQRAAESVFETNLKTIESDPKVVKNLKKIKNSTITLQGALLSCDVKTGEILAMIGGRNFRVSQFNRATQAYRQPGSSFKPIIYTAALENGFKATTILEDAPLVYLNDGRDWYLASRTTDFLLTLDKKTLEDPMKTWVPQNYKRKYRGLVTFRQALEHSLNSVAIRILETITPAKAISYARKMGITSPLTNTLSLALGSSDVTLYEMVRAFGTLANYGVRTKPYAIKKVVDRDGRVLLENRPEEEEVMSAATSFVMTYIMKGVIDRGTARAIRGIDSESAGKTGTTNDNTDAWFIGYTPEIVCGVWVGFDDKTPLGEGMTGGRVAAPIWRDLIKTYTKTQTEFSIPRGVVLKCIDPATGLLASEDQTKTFTEAFISGTEPTEYASAMPEEILRVQPVIEDDSEGF